MRILHIDDDPLIWDLVTETFRRVLPEAMVQSCADAASALESLRHHDPALILLDENLPDMTAADLVDRIRAAPLRCQARIVLVTGTAHDGVPEWAQVRGVIGYIHKPFRLQSLVPRILECMAGDPTGISC